MERRVCIEYLEKEAESARGKRQTALYKAIETLYRMEEAVYRDEVLEAIDFKGDFDTLEEAKERVLKLPSCADRG